MPRFVPKEDRLTTTVDISDCVVQFNNGKIFGSLGGLSGGPVFVWRKTPLLVAELIGFIYEYQPDYDLMFVRLARVLREDGTIVPSSRF